MCSTSARQAKRASTTLGSHWEPRALAEDLVDLRRGEPAAVGAGARHGVERVGDGEDAGRQRDRLAGEARGVAGAVEALVVVAHAGQEVVELLEVGEDVDADLDVRLDQPVLLRRERAGLLQDGVVDADLADVVEQAHQVEVAPLVRRDAQLLGRAGRRSAPRARSGPRCTGPWRRWPRSGRG